MFMQPVVAVRAPRGRPRLCIPRLPPLFAAHRRPRSFYVDAGFRGVPCLASRVVLVVIIFVVVMIGLGQAGQVQVFAALMQLMRHSRYWSQQRA